MLIIDGSLGEGGGQVLRTSLTLACISQTPIQLTNIRARRPNPGLQAQHLQAVRAVTAISQGEISGDKLESQSLFFQPGPIQPGKYRFDIGTAGSTSLVLQTIFLPLCFADGGSYVTITGGTHVSWSPAFHYLERSWLPVLRQMGVQASLKLDRAGFYPRGGGQIQAEIHPIKILTPLRWRDRGQLLGISGLSGAANLPAHVAKRQRDQAIQHLGEVAKIDILEMSARSPGSMLLLQAAYERGVGCYVELGKKGKPAEQVAEEAVKSLEKFAATTATTDEYLADQLLLPFALADGVSEIHTAKVTQHLLTNAAVIEQFGRAGIMIDSPLGLPGRVGIVPS